MAAIIISLLAFLATLYQLYLQRVHNEKSLRPLVQIEFTDYNGLLKVHVQNNGVGPYIIERLVFFKDDKVFFNIEDCLDIRPNSYQHVMVTESVKKVVQHGNYLEIFAKKFDEGKQLQMEETRKQLSVLNLKVEGRDIYNNRIIAKRNLSWFTRHSKS